MLYAAGIYAFVVACWVMYLAIMALAPHRGSMSLFVKVHAYILLGAGYCMDLALNITASAILFLDVPRDWLFTGSLKYHKAQGGWRAKIASWICANLLNPFDPKGPHC